MKPGVLAKYIRESIPWLDDHSASITPDAIQTFFSKFWSFGPHIDIPFDHAASTEHNSQDDDILGAITKKELKSPVQPAKERERRETWRHFEKKKHINYANVKEALRLFYNLIFLCRSQPSAWNTNRTILIPKQGHALLRIENYRPLTIGSILSRIYWGILDNRLRGHADFSPRQKGFVSESGCFNTVHALAEILWLAEAQTGIVIIPVDTSKASDTTPHQAIDPALQKLAFQLQSEPPLWTHISSEKHLSNTKVLRWGSISIEE